MDSTTLFTTTMASPVGRLRIAVDGDGALVRIDFPGHDAERGAEREDAARCAHVTTQLREYFEGQRTEFDLALRPRGTPFQLAAWRALRQIPFAETRSYQQQAEKIGNKNAMRAVGAANGRNPIPIVVPCHRVVPSGGGVGKYGGQEWRKEFLLDLEGALAQS
jgi:methylated-DNA-[protein]-cysteine S-methyltransferase